MKKELYILILCVVLCLLVRSPNTFDETKAVRHVILAAFVLVLFVMVTLKGGTIKVCGIFGAFSIYILFAILSLGKAISFHRGLYEVLRLVCLLGLLYVGSEIFQNHREQFYKAMIVIGLLVGGFGVYHYFTTEKISRLVGLMSNRNQWSAVQLLFLPFCFTYNTFLAKSIKCRIPKSKIKTVTVVQKIFSQTSKIFSPKCFFILSIIAACLLLFNIITICTRSVWAALIGASVVTVFTFKLIPKVRYILLVGALLAVSVFCASFKTNIYSKTISTESFNLRCQKWSKTLKMAGDNLFFGVGIGNWPIAVSAYGNNYIRESGTNETFFIRNHNGFMCPFSETGFMGGLAYLSIFAYGLHYARLRQNKAMFFGILCYMGFAFFSFPSERPFQAMIPFIMIATVIPYHRKVLSEKTSYLMCLVMTVVLAGAVLDFSLRYRSEIYTKLLIQAKEREKWQDVINYYDKGHSKLAPFDNLICAPIIMYRAEAFIRLNNIPQALEDFKKALRLHPYHTYVIANAGACYHLRGDLKTAESLYVKSLEVTPNFMPSMKNLKSLRRKQ